jgi:hypothetical protein
MSNPRSASSDISRRLDSVFSVGLEVVDFISFGIATKWMLIRSSQDYLSQTHINAARMSSRPATKNNRSQVCRGRNKTCGSRSSEKVNRFKGFITARSMRAGF